MVGASYYKFAMANRRFVAFGFLAAFASSFGQTYFIGIFGPGIQAEFGFSHTTWATIYLVGTLASAALLPFTGKLIDRTALRRYTTWVCLLLMLACGATALVTGMVTLVLAVFQLRHAGQGLMSHTATTTMARYFDSGRGRAIAIATLGYSAGEALLPFVAVLVIAAIGWRLTYAGVAVLLGLAMLPAINGLLKGRGDVPPCEEAGTSGAKITSGSHQRSWTRAEVLRDPRIWLLLPGLLAPSIILTAMFFHHLTLADAKGWSHAWITGSYVIYAGATTLTSLASGPLIDRFGAVRLVPYMLIPLILGMVAVALMQSPLTVWLYMVLIGLCVGIVHTGTSAMWPELYGVGHLGAIKSMVTAVGVFATALGPVTMGGLVDRGIPIEQVCLFFAAYMVLGTVLMMMVFRRKRGKMTAPVGWKRP